jgi:Tfp pilus assembly protein PilN
MIKLNLLPSKVRAAEALRLILILGVVVYVVAAVGVAMRWTQAKARVAAAQLEVDAVNAELNAPNLISTVQAVEKFTKDKADEQAKASVVNTYRKQQVALLRLLDALPDWTSAGDVWLEKITADNNSGKVTLEGAAMGSLAFARFYGMLENQALVKGLKMPDKSTVKAVRGINAYGFKLEFTLEGVK